jgi:hypothetical protein
MISNAADRVTGATPTFTMDLAPALDVIGVIPVLGVAVAVLAETLLEATITGTVAVDTAAVIVLRDVELAGQFVIEDAQPITVEMKVVNTVETDSEEMELEAGEVALAEEVEDCVAVTGQMVVDTAMTTVVTLIEFAGQFVMVDAQLVIVDTKVEKTVEVVNEVALWVDTPVNPLDED